MTGPVTVTKLVELAELYGVPVSDLLAVGGATRAAAVGSPSLRIDLRRLAGVTGPAGRAAGPAHGGHPLVPRRPPRRRAAGPARPAGPGRPGRGVRHGPGRRHRTVHQLGRPHRRTHPRPMTTPVVGGTGPPRLLKHRARPARHVHRGKGSGILDPVATAAGSRGRRWPVEGRVRAMDPTPQGKGRMRVATLTPTQMMTSPAAAAFSDARAGRPGPGVHLGRCHRLAGSTRGRQHGEPVPRGLLDQDRHELPGRMAVEPAMTLPHHPGHHRRRHHREPRRKALPHIINRHAFGVEKHHLPA